ncbi:MAG TPA: hypothetical protein V6D20_22600, partial [Candidatus Obscuribacterales bacterium]
MEDVFQRLYLYLLSAEAALQNGSLPQAESLLKAAITLVQEVPLEADFDGSGRAVSTGAALASYLRSFCGLLIVMPGHPEHGPFYLTKGLIKVVKEYPWPEGSTGRANVFLGMISLFAGMNGKLPYHIAKLESNDLFYLGDEDYKEELQAIINKLVEEVLEELSKLKEMGAGSQQVANLQCRVALDFFNHTTAHSELNSKSAKLAVNLFQMSKKSSDSAIKAYRTSSVDYLERAGRPGLSDLASEL